MDDAAAKLEPLAAEQQEQEPDAKLERLAAEQQEQEPDASPAASPDAVTGLEDGAQRRRSKTALKDGINNKQSSLKSLLIIVLKHLPRKERHHVYNKEYHQPAEDELDLRTHLILHKIRPPHLFPRAQPLQVALHVRLSPCILLIRLYNWHNSSRGEVCLAGLGGDAVAGG